MQSKAAAPLRAERLAMLILLKMRYRVLYNALFANLLAYHLAIFAGALVLLCLPAVCMGATLPFLYKFYVRRLVHLGTHAGMPFENQSAFLQAISK